jgi:hypothetical protein
MMEAAAACPYLTDVTATDCEWGPRGGAPLLAALFHRAPRLRDLNTQGLPVTAA